mgnify:CR=1 FL=1
MNTAVYSRSPFNRGETLSLFSTKTVDKKEALKMSSVQDTEVCLACNKEYLVDFDCRTGEYTKIGTCRCDRKFNVVLRSRNILRQKVRKMRNQVRQLQEELAV